MRDPRKNLYLTWKHPVITSHPLGWLLFTFLVENNKCWQGCGDAGICALLLGMQSGAAARESSSVVLNNVNVNMITLWSKNPRLGTTSKELKAVTQALVHQGP